MTEPTYTEEDLAEADKELEGVDADPGDETEDTEAAEVAADDLAAEEVPEDEEDD